MSEIVVKSRFLLTETLYHISISLNTKREKLQRLGNGDLVWSRSESERRKTINMQRTVYELYLVGKRAKQARHSQVCSIENRDICVYCSTYVCHICPLTLKPIKKVERNFEIATGMLCSLEKDARGR